MAKFNWSVYPADVRRVAADIIFREGIRKSGYPAAYERAAVLVEGSPELREVVAAYAVNEATTRELGAAIESAEAVLADRNDR
jgi:hypothetical protein